MARTWAICSLRTPSLAAETPFREPIPEGSHHGEHTVEIPRYVCQTKPIKVAPYIIDEVREIAGDTSKPIFIVEAPLKALSLTANGFPAVGLGGVLAGATNTDVLDALERSSCRRRCNGSSGRLDSSTSSSTRDSPTTRWLPLGQPGLHSDSGVRGPTYGSSRFPSIMSKTAILWRARCGGKRIRGQTTSSQGTESRSSRSSSGWRSSQNPTTRMSRAASGSDRTDAVAHLLGELSVQAMLHEGGALVIDQVAVVAKVAGVGKKAIQQAARSFADRMSRRAQQDRAEWKSNLKCSATGILRPITLNVETCMRGDPPLEGLVAWDDFRQTVIFRRSPPWTEEYPDARAVVDGTPWADEDDTRLSGYMGRSHELLDVPLTSDRPSSDGGQRASWPVLGRYVACAPPPLRPRPRFENLSPSARCS